MPTGYTAYVQDGTITEFRDFALLCARAMGACVTLRDEPFDAPLPERMEPDTTYHDEKLAKAKARLAEVRAMTDADAVLGALKDYEDAMRRHHEREATRILHQARYEAMQRAVKEWKPPTEEHEGLKGFMCKQLRQSLDFDCGDHPDEVPAPLSPGAWRDREEKAAIRDLAYHTEKREEEVMRTEARNRWLAALRQSLPAGDEMAG